MTKKRYTKRELRKLMKGLIDALDDGEYEIYGTFGWSFIELDIKKSEKEEGD